MMFCKEILLTLKDLPSRDRMLEAAKRWAALSEEKKTEYNEKAKTAVNFYLTELEAFKEVITALDCEFRWCFVKHVWPRNMNSVGLIGLTVSMY